jgi:hypothetical protein
MKGLLLLFLLLPPQRQFPNFPSHDTTNFTTPFDPVLLDARQHLNGYFTNPPHDCPPPCFSQTPKALAPAHLPSSLTDTPQTETMFCDNCLLLFPLRSGALAWNIIICVRPLPPLALTISANTHPATQLYSAVGGYLLVTYGQYWSVFLG